MSNKKGFKKSLGARVRIRPLPFHALLGKYLDEDWIIDTINESEFEMVHTISDMRVKLRHDARRKWDDNIDCNNGIKRGFLTLNGQITLENMWSCFYEPLQENNLIIAHQKIADKR